MKAADFKNPVTVAVPVLTPERAEKRQNGRRCKENGEEMFTLTAQDRHGVAISVSEQEENPVFLKLVPVGGGYVGMSDGFDRGILEGVSRTLKSTKSDACVALGVDLKAEAQPSEHPDAYIKISENCTVYAVWSEKYDCYIAIRKLTPRECFRLQGFSDQYFDRAQFVNSDSQLYKQAGNSVTTNVVYEIAKALKEQEKKNEHTENA